MLGFWKPVLGNYLLKNQLTDDSAYRLNMEKKKMEKMKKIR